MPPLYYLKNRVIDSFTTVGFTILEYERLSPEWIQLTIEANQIPRHEVGVRAVAACSLSVDVREIRPLGNDHYIIKLEVDDRVTLNGVQVTKLL